MFHHWSISHQTWFKITWTPLSNRIRPFLIIPSASTISGTWHFSQFHFLLPNQLDSKKLESTRIEVRIGDYPNSYQLVDSSDPIFSSVYPLSLALILGNENAVMAIFKHKSLLSKEHFEQAGRIAVFGFSTDLFYRCKAGAQANSCIIS